MLRHSGYEPTVELPTKCTFGELRLDMSFLLFVTLAEVISLLELVCIATCSTIEVTDVFLGHFLFVVEFVSVYAHTTVGPSQRESLLCSAGQAMTTAICA